MLAVQITPLDTLALHYLLPMHLLQNVALAEWAPLLVVLGPDPGDGARSSSASRARASLTHPFVALPVWLATYYAWHLALGLRRRAPTTSGRSSTLEHACYFAAGVPRLVAGRPRPHARRGGEGALPLRRVRARQPARAAARAPAQARSTTSTSTRRAVGPLAALADQQLAGVTMAAEQAVVFFVVLRDLPAAVLRGGRRAPTRSARPTVPRS